MSNEIKANLGEIERDIIGIDFIITGKAGYNELEKYLINNSDTYCDIFRYLTLENKKYVLKTIATYLINRGQIKRVGKV
jgi:hypothetical protein